MQTTNIVSVVSGQFDTTETRGEIAVKEIYGEVLAPVLKDLPFVKTLELNAGYRFSDYDTNSGSDSHLEAHRQLGRQRLHQGAWRPPGGEPCAEHRRAVLAGRVRNRGLDRPRSVLEPDARDLRQRRVEPESGARERAVRAAARA